MQQTPSKSESAGATGGESPATQNQGAPKEARARILLADDDASVRDSLERVLRDSGYEVLLACDGREAVARLGKEAADLLLLDITMPHQNGWEIFEHVIVCHPELPVVIITGMAHQRQTEIARAAGAFLEKPLDVAALLDTLRASLEEPAEARLRRRQTYLEGMFAISGAGPRGAVPPTHSWSHVGESGPAPFMDADIGKPKP